MTANNQDFTLSAESPADSVPVMVVGSTALLGSDGFSDFKEWCAKEKLRAGIKETINTTTSETNYLFTIEIRIKPRKYLPLRMPDGSWYFTDAAQRDEVLAALMPNR